MRKNNNNINKITKSGLLLAIGLVLPFVTMQIPAVGKMLCPMHIPVLICGMICGWQYGLIVGIVTPLLRGCLFGMPVLIPNGITMAFELGMYGLVGGLVYFRRKRWKNETSRVYVSLISAMIAGRIVWGISSYIVFRLLGSVFTWKMFLMGAFVNAVPGILIQLIFIPAIVKRLNKGKNI